VVICCWSSKGGAGTTVVAAALAITLARGAPTTGSLLVDLAGDAPTVLGLPTDPGEPGVAGWLRDRTMPSGLAEVAVAPHLSLLPRGAGPLRGDAADELLTLLDDDPRPVVVDAGVLAGPVEAELGLSIAAAATHSLLVLRPCFVAVRRALHAPLRPSAIVLVEEDGRALTAADVEATLGVPVRARVRVSAQVARAVDAGLLAIRMPPSLERDLRDAA
jgi:hypothetical protein